MGIAIWILVGLAAGAAAKFVMPGPNAGGVPVAMLLGVAGALAGGFAGAYLAGGFTAAIDVRSMLMAISGTLYALLGYRSLAMRGGEALL